LNRLAQQFSLTKSDLESHQSVQKPVDEP
jgi:hypothetical protein